MPNEIVVVDYNRIKVTGSKVAVIGRSYSTAADGEKAVWQRWMTEARFRAWVLHAITIWPLLLLGGCGAQPQQIAKNPGRTKTLDEQSRIDLALIQGKWRIDDFRVAGDQVSQQIGRPVFIEKSTLVISGARRLPEKRFDFELDATSNPKRISYPTETDAVNGIYELTGDQLIIVQSSVRPESFDPNGGLSADAARQPVVFMRLHKATAP
ncbi:MAG TPA: TIGR03067 domain-containing protein [Planctomycetaceae bacterium]|jgi:uncharacterized protein (TIGR03067 family)|nr:TIGR03067 domain-containing protein [Planctomycetaceae bacterium]